MKKYGIHIGVACALLLMVSILLVSCSSDNDSGEPRDGMIANETPYQVQVNFESLKVIQVAPNTVVRENVVEPGTTYPVSITVFGSAGEVLETRQLSVYIDRDSNDQTLGGLKCSWYIRVFGSAGPFGYEAGS